MPEFKYRKLGEALIDVILLIFFLKIGFTIRPAERPAEVMLITAAATYLIILGRSDRFGRAGLIAAVVIAMLYIFYWEQPADAFPLLLWGGGNLVGAASPDIHHSSNAPCNRPACATSAYC